MNAPVRTRRWLGVLAVPVVALATIAVVTAQSSALTAPTGVVDKVWICHANSSDTNQYVANQPAASGTVDGHAGHTGPVWSAGLKAQHISWGDIIPPFDYGDPQNPSHFAGLNWNAAGQAIYANDCDPGDASFTVQKVVEGTGTPGATQDYSLHVTCTIDTNLESGPTTLVDENISLKAGETSNPYTLPAGAVCSVSENDTESLPNLVDASNDGPVTLAAVGGQYSITETNTFEAPPVVTGSLVVKKVATGAVENAPATVSIHVACDDETTADLTLPGSGGSSEPITGIAAGAKCTVTETGTLPADTVTKYDPAGPDGTSAVVTIAADQQATATVTNEYAEVAGEVVVVPPTEVAPAEVAPAQVIVIQPTFTG